MALDCFDLFVSPFYISCFLAVFEFLHYECQNKHILKVN